MMEHHAGVGSVPQHQPNPSFSTAPSPPVPTTVRVAVWETSSTETSVIRRYSRPCPAATPTRPSKKSCPRKFGAENPAVPRHLKTCVSSAKKPLEKVLNSLPLLTLSPSSVHSRFHSPLLFSITHTPHHRRNGSQERPPLAPQALQRQCRRFRFRQTPWQISISRGKSKKFSYPRHWHCCTIPHCTPSGEEGPLCTVWPADCHHRERAKCTMDTIWPRRLPNT